MTAPAEAGAESAPSPSVESSRLEVPGKLSLSRPLYIVCVGRKGSGKSKMAKLLFDGFPGDRVCIDPTGDVLHEFPEGYFRTIPNGVELRQLPIRDDEPRATLRLQPKRSSASYAADMDQAVALTLTLGKARGRVMLWVDEGGRVARRDQVLPHYSELLEEGRHSNVFSLLCMPRPVDVDPLCIMQADYIYIFDLPNPVDVQRLAAIAGVDPKALAEALRQLPPHGYIRFDASASPQSGHRLIAFPPLPKELL